MAWEIWFTLAVVGVVLVTLAASRAPTELVLIGAMVVLSLGGVITTSESLSGFSSPGVKTIAALYFSTMLVYGTGGYRFMDFVRFGLPLNLLCGIMTVIIVPRVWPF